MQRDRAAANTDFVNRLRAEMAWHVSDRISDVSRTCGYTLCSIYISGHIHLFSFNPIMVERTFVLCAAVHCVST
jgi:hypothetical protein